MSCKICSKCSRKLNIELFSKDKQKKDGLRSSCKECSKTTNKNKWAKNKLANEIKYNKEYDNYINNGYCKIKGYEEYDYIINKDGKVFSKRRRGGGGFITPKINKNGYLSFMMCCKEKKPLRLNLHRALALTFLPNPKNLPVVDHIDRDRINNNLNNLRWVDYSLNAKNKTVHGCICEAKDKRKVCNKIYTYIYYRVFYTLPNGKRHSKRFKEHKQAEQYLEELIKTHPR